MAKGTPLLSLENVFYSAPGGKLILNGVNLELSRDQTVALRGKNGSGKTTLFRCITGLNKIDSGVMRLNGKQIKASGDYNALRREVGYVLQDPDNQIIFPAVLEDVSFGPLNLGLKAEEAERRARETLNMVGLKGFEESIPHELSGGEKRLVALAAMLAMRPAVLLLDEPLNELDDVASERICEVIQNANCAKIIVSHNPVIFPANAATYELADGVLRRTK